MSQNPQIDAAGSSQINGFQQRHEEKKAIDGYGRRAKRVVLSNVKKVKKRLQRNKQPLFCCWCVGGMPSRDSGTESPTSDPNSSGFGFDSLRGLIEKSDFLLDECNTHLDVYIGDDDKGVDSGTDDDVD